MTASRHDSMTASEQTPPQAQPQDPSRAARASRRLQALEQQVRLLSEMSDQNEARLDGISEKLDEICRLLDRAGTAPGPGDEPVEPSDVEIATFGESLPPELRAVYDAVGACRHDVGEARGSIDAVRTVTAEALKTLGRVESGVTDARDGLSSLTEEVSSLAADVRATAEQRVEGRARMPQRHGARDPQGPGISQGVGVRPGMGGGAARGWGSGQVMDDGLGGAAYDDLAQRVSESCDEIRSVMKSSVRDIASVAMNVRDTMDAAASQARALPAPPAEGPGDAAAEPEWAGTLARQGRLACALAAAAAAASAASLLLQVVG